MSFVRKWKGIEKERMSKRTGACCEKEEQMKRERGVKEPKASKKSNDPMRNEKPPLPGE